MNLIYDHIPQVFVPSEANDSENWEAELKFKSNLEWDHGLNIFMKTPLMLQTGHAERLALHSKQQT